MQGGSALALIVSGIQHLFKLQSIALGDILEIAVGPSHCRKIRLLPIVCCYKECRYKASLKSNLFFLTFRLFFLFRINP